MSSLLFSRLPVEKRKLLKDIGRCADDLRIPAYLVGGVVRDLLLRRPVGDIDIVTEGPAVTLAQAWAKRKKAKCVAYARFGTATVYLSRGEAVDFVTARSEIYAHPGALPVVKEGSIRDDLFRRDFTINAMAVPLRGKADEVVDPFKGGKDLKSGLIRVMHDKSFTDDPTRVLRAVRFEQRFGFRAEPATLRWLKTAVTSGAMDTLKPERIFTEFKKNLDEEAVALNLKRLDGLHALGWLNASFWRWRKMEGERIVSLEGSRRWCARYALPVPPRWLLVWMLLFRDSPLEQAVETSLRFGIGAANVRSLKQATTYRICLEKLNASGLAPSDVCRALRGWSIPALVFIRALAASQRQRRYIGQYMRHWMTVVIPVNGEDLARMGLPAGPRFKSCLDQLKNMYLDGTAVTRSQLLRQAQAFARAE